MKDFQQHSLALSPHPTGPGPYLPKPHAVYEMMEAMVSPRKPNILSSTDSQYWRAVRQATAPCFSLSNLKQVGWKAMACSLGVGSCCVAAL